LCWYTHREPYIPYNTMVKRIIRSISSPNNVHGVIDDNINPYKNMVMDVMRINWGHVGQCSIVDEERNGKMFNIKSSLGLSEAGYDKNFKWMRNILPKGNKLKDNFYAVKSMMKPLGLGYQKIITCSNFFILSYLENTCRHSCYKFTRGR